MKSKVFVYGTLLSGQCNNDVLCNATKLCDATTEQKYRMYTNGGYPMIVRDHDGNGGVIQGEVWEVDSETLKSLDRLEGTASGMYLRDVCTFTDKSKPESKKHPRAFIYVWLRETERLQEITSGDWRNR